MRAMRRAGYDKVCQTYDVPFFDLKKDRTRPVKTAVGNIDVCCRALDAGLLVDLPVLKGHCQTVMTCALKNLKGCLPDREKRHFHAMGLTRPIAALGEVVLRTWIEGAASLSPNVDRDVYTGRTSISDSLCLFALRLPITEGEAFEEARVEARRMGVGGLYLPLALERLIRREVRHTVERADPALIQARLAPLARADAALRLASEGPRDCEIVRSWIDYEETPGALRARAVYEIHTNAAVTREALLKGWR